MGVGAKRHFINITNLYDTLGENLANSLPSRHALTGNILTRLFMQKGEVHPYKLLKGSREFQEAFQLMGSTTVIVLHVRVKNIR